MIDESNAGQILPRSPGPVERSLREMRKRISCMREEVDAMTNLANGLYDRQNELEKRLDAFYDAFCRHVHKDDPGEENAVNALETRQERERHA